MAFEDDMELVAGRELAGELQAIVLELLDRQPQTIAILVDRPSVDELHRKPRLPIGGDTAVEQSSDSRMVERGENLPLLEKSL